MSGGGGGIIIIKNVVVALSDPIVSGSLPVTMRSAVVSVCEKDPADMTEYDRKILSLAVDWALKNLQ
jgi:hypothetical protein